jgi:hypothetical protein
MRAESLQGKKNIGAASASSFISDVHRLISPTDVARLRDVFNGAIEIPITKRKAWLMQNVADPDERQAIATLLLAYDGDGLFDVDAN